MARKEAKNSEFHIPNSEFGNAHGPASFCASRTEHLGKGLTRPMLSARKAFALGPQPRHRGDVKLYSPAEPGVYLKEITTCDLRIQSKLKSTAILMVLVVGRFRIFFTPVRREISVRIFSICFQEGAIRVNQML
jgi:hypothetical protein